MGVSEISLREIVEAAKGRCVLFDDSSGEKGPFLLRPRRFASLLRFYPSFTPLVWLSSRSYGLLPLLKIPNPFPGPPCLPSPKADSRSRLATQSTQTSQVLPMVGAMRYTWDYMDTPRISLGCHTSTQRPDVGVLLSLSWSVARYTHIPSGASLLLAPALRLTRPQRMAPNRRGRRRRTARIPSPVYPSVDRVRRPLPPTTRLGRRIQHPHRH
ncbi:hypothetical protein FA13DRAFT_804040 [Coprinellus micaceus]|uniref:Uncharacterized protein n=1 Tax=Coprinellus micaceus TaxID=71717 RepID=A0A4Y7T2E2_COPMI|nr:hypothetical protein FA13DRAFT_804040 [Coprinellus micaceus]